MKTPSVSETHFFKIIDRFEISNFGHCYLFVIWNLLFEIYTNMLHTATMLLTSLGEVKKQISYIS